MTPELLDARIAVQLAYIKVSAAWAAAYGLGTPVTPMLPRAPWPAVEFHSGWQSWPADDQEQR